MLRFVNPAIVHPQSYMLIDGSPSVNPRRTLTYVAKLLQNLANKPTHFKEEYMADLHNTFISENTERFRKFLLDLCEVADFHEQLEVRQGVIVVHNGTHSIEDRWISILPFPRKN
jgi:Ras GTPase-activating-like protein IQGAP2/3